MKLTQTEINNLINMIQHTRADISYGVGGSFYDSDNTQELDEKAIKRVEKAIDIIKRIILTSK